MVALHSDGNYYPLFEEPANGECPESYCLWGWNTGDMVTSESYKVGVKLMSYVNPTGWGYVNGGLGYVPNGFGLDDGLPYDVGAAIVVKVKAIAGKPVVVYAKDKTSYGVAESVPRYKFTGTGDWQTVFIPNTELKPGTYSHNTFNPAQARAIMVEYEYAATSSGQACMECSDAVMDLEWQSLRVWR